MSDDAAVIPDHGCIMEQHFRSSMTCDQAKNGLLVQVVFVLLQELLEVIFNDRSLGSVIFNIVGCRFRGRNIFELVDLAEVYLHEPRCEQHALRQVLSDLSVALSNSEALVLRSFSAFPDILSDSSAMRPALLCLRSVKPPPRMIWSSAHTLLPTEYIYRPQRSDLLALHKPHFGLWDV